MLLMASQSSLLVLLISANKLCIFLAIPLPHAIYWRRQELSFGAIAQGVWGLKSPVGSRGEAPVGV